MSRRSVRFALLVTAAAGCAYRTPAVHAPPVLPGFEVSDVTVFDHAGAGDEEKVRERTFDLLRHAAKPGAARASVRVSIAYHDPNIYSRSLAQDGCAAMGMVGVPVGQIIDRESVVVDVSIVETDGRVHRGWAVADKHGSLYAPASKRALASALDKALADAATQ
jgi:hypothetical protein